MRGTKYFSTESRTQSAFALTIADANTGTVVFSTTNPPNLTYTNAGTEVVEAKAGGGSATLSMGQAACRFGLSLVRALQGEEGVVECAYVEGDGEHATYFAQPVKLGKEGVEEVLSYGKLSDYEKSALDGMLETLNGDINIGVEFAK